MTIKEIARISGVSIATVSRIINNTGSGYSPETYNKVQAIIRQSGYVPSPLARAMITNRTCTIGLVMRNILNPFFPEIARGIEDVASAQDFSVMLFNSDDNPDRERKNLELLREKRVDGCIITTASLWSNPNIDALLQFGIPFVVIDADSAGSCYYNVSVDNYTGAKTIVTHLIEWGHRDIACISGPARMESSQLRVSGYKHALAEGGLAIRPQLIVEGDYTVQGGQAAMERLEANAYTAVFACNDMMAIGIYRHLHSKGLRIPQDVSVAGFDDIAFAAYLHPPLTTMRQPAYEMGQAAMRLLVKAMNKEDHKDKMFRETFDLPLVSRESVSVPAGPGARPNFVEK